ncbi:MAG: hypothetical protein R3Y36_05100 [Spirochaetales bacterium]
MADNEKLKELYKWFDKNRNIIIKDHVNQVVLLKDNAIIAYYDDEKTAIEEALNKGLKQGDFLVQRCISAEEDGMTYYNKAVKFA